MKARNTNTGEVVDNFGFSKEYGTVSYTDKNGILTLSTAASGEWEIIDDQEGSVDWQAFRREAAKDFMSAIIVREAPQYDVACRNVATRVSEAIMWADELVKQLQKKD